MRVIHWMIMIRYLNLASLSMRNACPFLSFPFDENFGDNWFKLEFPEGTKITDLTGRK
jgi:hypothetical protein